ncbi:hypothetical protein BCh11DRAFT_07232 [Burkholderia sp. Ch1-1]|nr:hypothetical protein BCh11DRAFT_07232 [Burkholderia sp. Ch1-1]
MAAFTDRIGRPGDALHSVAFLLVAPVFTWFAAWPRTASASAASAFAISAFATATALFDGAHAVPRPLAVLPVRGYPVVDTTQRDAGVRGLHP